MRRNIMVPMLNAESHGQLTRYMLERCDAMAKETHYRDRKSTRLNSSH